METPRSRIILTDRFDEAVESLRQAWPEAEFYRFDADEFLIGHAQAVIDRAHLTSERPKVLLLCAGRFSPLAQNKLLKILEEPPAKTHFVLITPSKAALLPTVRSRLIIEESERRDMREETKLGDFDLQRLFELIQSHRHTDAATARTLVASLARAAVREGYRMDKPLLEAFERGVKLLDMGSPPSFVLAMIGTLLTGRRP